MPGQRWTHAGAEASRTHIGTAATKDHGHHQNHRRPGGQSGMRRGCEEAGPAGRIASSLVIARRRVLGFILRAGAVRAAAQRLAIAPFGESVAIAHFLGSWELTGWRRVSLGSVAERTGSEQEALPTV